MNKDTLISSIKKSGGAIRPREVDALLSKLNYLLSKRQYSKLLKSISKANNRDNFLSAIFEATFAYQFEFSGCPLEYEVRQDIKSNSSIDFLRKMESGLSIYIEARQLQQEKSRSELIERQLERTQFYRVAMDGNDVHDAIIRLQAVILSKVQKEDGTPTKFLSYDNDTVNLVAVDVSDLILGAIDIYDCRLATHGDLVVDDMYRRGVFGLFQEPAPDCSEKIRRVARSFDHVRETLHGVLFLFKAKGSGVIDYSLEQNVIWNPLLVDKDIAKSVYNELARSIPVRSNESQ